MSLLLHIETSETICSVALAENGNLIRLRETTEERQHASALAVLIQDLMAETGTSIKSLDAVAVSKGPGSYTGLRIGVSTAKGICYAKDIPLIAVGTLDAMTQGLIEQPELVSITNDTLLCPMIDARRMEVYRALYNAQGKRIEEVQAEILQADSFDYLPANQPIILFGSGAAKCNKLIEISNICIIEQFSMSARFMIKLAYALYNDKSFENTAYFEPFYLKDFVATTPKNKVF